MLLLLYDNLISWVLADATTRSLLASVFLLGAAALIVRRASGLLKIHPTLPPRPLGLGLPFVGNLPSLNSNAHFFLTDLQKRHGDVLSLRLGSWPAVVIGGQASVKKAFVHHGQALSSRPSYRSYSNYAGGKSISFQPYTNALKLHRRLTLKIIKDLVESGFAEEIITRQVKHLTDVWLQNDRRGKPFDPAKDVTLAVAGGLYSMCYGRDVLLSEDKDFEDLFLQTNPATELLAFGNPVDLVPEFLCPSKSHKKYDEFVQRMDTFTRLNEKQVRCHQSRDQNGKSSSAYVYDDVTDSMIKASRDLDESSGLTEGHLLNTPIEILSAGSDTSSTTLLWLLYYMAKHPEIQAKIHEEIHREMESSRTVSYSIRRQLPYTEAAILEMMRLRTIVPFGLPHFSTEDVHLNGLTIPKHCLVFMNLWSVGRDENLWKDADCFRPDRFLITRGSDVYVDESKVNMFYPFGVGRRRCVGEMLGRVQVFLFFANIMQQCTIRTAAEDASLTDKEEFGDILKPSSYAIYVDRHPNLR